jgi:hypothetical protein
VPAPLDSAIEGSPHEGQPPAEPMPFETAALPDVAPDARDAPPFWEPEPTQAMDALELEREQAPEPHVPQPFGRSVFPEGTELLPTPEPERSAATTGAPHGETEQLSALDALFGESQFREYDNRPDPGESPFARRAAPPPGPPADGSAPPAPVPPAGISTLQKVLLIVLGSILGVVALIALFFLGTRLPSFLGPAPAVTEPTGTPSPSPSAEIAIGPVAPGEYHWDELLGGECIDPYVDPWQDTYTVVDCAVPHAAQMVRTGEFPIPETGPEPYPGEEALQAQALGRCRAAGIFSPAAGKVTDAQVAASYPVAAEDWDAGNRRYYCFVFRSSGEPLTEDIALPQPTPAPTPAP